MFYFYSKIELTRLYRLNVVGFGLHRHKNSRAYSNDSEGDSQERG